MTNKKRVKVLTLPPKSPVDLRSSSFAPQHSSQAISVFGLASVDNVGLGSAPQNNISTRLMTNKRVRFPFKLLSTNYSLLTF